MTARETRRRLSDEDIEALVGQNEDPVPLLRAVGAVAEGFGERWRDVVDAAPIIAARARSRIRLLRGREAAMDRLYGDGWEIVHALHFGRWHERARGASEIDRSGLWPDPALAVIHASEEAHVDDRTLLDGRVASEALAVAAHEVLDPRFLAHHERLGSLATLVGTGARHVSDAWERSFEACLGRAAKNARVIGRAGERARADVMVAEIVVRGRALSERAGADPETVMGLGSAALTRPPEAGWRPNAMLARTLGAAAVGAAFGFAHGWREAPAAPRPSSIEVADASEDDALIVIDGRAIMRFGSELMGSLAPLTHAAAARRLRAIAADPLMDAPSALRARTLSDALDRSGRGKRHDLSFARLVGLEERAPDVAEVEEGMLLHDASPVGPHSPVLVCVGKNGRELVCRAVADDSGRLVGYRAYDALSDEFHEEPLHVVYDLEGRLAGRMEHGRFRAGPPPRRPMTAPQTLQRKEAVR